MSKNKSNKLNELQKLEDTSFNVESCYSEELPLEEKITRTVLYLSKIDGIPNVESLLNNLKLQKSNALSLYDILSSEIKNKLWSHLEELFELKLNSSRLERSMDHLLYVVRTNNLLPNNLTQEHLPRSKEYRQFLSLYSENMNFQQGILKLKSSISLLLDSQRLLDKNFAVQMSQIDYQIISLARILSNLNEARREEVDSLYASKFDRVEELIRDITSREDKFNKLRLSMKLNPENFIYNGFKKNILNDLNSLDQLVVTRK
ncbi:hypothetical protein OVS_03735 [Mycoplasma ovis str. Michigan]|uniref:Uncharacterized protein n=1 Tax=Mycoplasma ovis str. Michigan TaxID=1415773 RepID=A0ABM5P0U6_9MOLU|nr:hypothetical protein [Mycoplasma ovis]AHC40046.1 hypothetical protein OVS_03735 [Mycoplasma ovis str. Michigan]